MEGDFIRDRKFIQFGHIFRFPFIHIYTFESILKNVLQFDFHNYDFGETASIEYCSVNIIKTASFKITSQNNECQLNQLLIKSCFL